MENPPTFHTVRSLANSLAKKVEESKEAIQKNNAHKSVDTQLIYQEGHDLPFDDAPIQFTADQRDEIKVLTSAHTTIDGIRTAA